MISKLIAISVFLVAPHILCYSNNRAIDSLRTCLKTAEGARRFDVLFELMFEYIDINDSIALTVANEAMEYTATVDSIKLVKIGRLRGQILAALGRYKEALTCLYRTLPLARQIKAVREEGLICHTVGVCYTMRGDYQNGLLSNRKAINSFTLAGDSARILSTLHNIGIAHYKMSNYDEALEYFEMSEDNRFLTGKKLARLYINKSLALMHSGRFPESRYYLGLAYCKYLKNHVDHRLMMEYNYALGQAEQLVCNYKKALHYYSESYRLAKQISDQRFEVEALFALAKTYFSAGNRSEALQLLTTAEVRSDDIKLEQILVDLYPVLISYYRENGEWEKARLYQERFTTLKEKLFSEKQLLQLVELKSEIKNRKHIELVGQLQQLSHLQKEQRSKTMYISIALILVAVCCSATILLLLRRMHRKVSAKSRLQRMIMERKATLPERVRRPEIYDDDSIDFRTRVTNIRQNIFDLQILVPDDLQETFLIREEIKRLDNDLRTLERIVEGELQTRPEKY
jgi:tetratricopeptide (TPR) repeat protein